VINRLLLLVLFLIGLYGIIGKKNIIKKIFGLAILNSTIVILFVMEGAKIGDEVPILAEGVSSIVDPVPQALMLTAIVIGVCVTALALSMAYRLFNSTGTFDIDEIRRKIYDDID
jgi:multicomponent Na+:H+ antiporter subunit C